MGNYVESILAMDEETHLITDDQVQKFQEDGAIHLKNVFSPHWVEVVKAGIQRNIASPSIHSERLALKENQVYRRHVSRYFSI